MFLFYTTEQYWREAENLFLDFIPVIYFYNLITTQHHSYVRISIHVLWNNPVVFWFSKCLNPNVNYYNKTLDFALLLILSFKCLFYHPKNKCLKWPKWSTNITRYLYLLKSFFICLFITVNAISVAESNHFLLSIGIIFITIIIFIIRRWREIVFTNTRHFYCNPCRTWPYSAVLVSSCWSWFTHSSRRSHWFWSRIPKRLYSDTRFRYPAL